MLRDFLQFVMHLVHFLLFQLREVFRDLLWPPRTCAYCCDCRVLGDQSLPAVGFILIIIIVVHFKISTSALITNMVFVLEVQPLTLCWCKWWSAKCMLKEVNPDKDSSCWFLLLPVSYTCLMYKEQEDDNFRKPDSFNTTGWNCSFVLKQI